MSSILSGPGCSRRVEKSVLDSGDVGVKWLRSWFWLGMICPYLLGFNWKFGMRLLVSDLCRNGRLDGSNGPELDVTNVGGEIDVQESQDGHDAKGPDHGHEACQGSAEEYTDTIVRIIKKRT